MPPRKKQPPAVVPPAPPLNLFDALDEIVGDNPELMLAAAEFEQSLLAIAHDIAKLAVRVGEPDQEAERVEAAHRQAKLVAAVYRELSEAIRPS